MGIEPTPQSSTEAESEKHLREQYALPNIAVETYAKAGDSGDVKTFDLDHFWGVVTKHS